VVQRIQQASRVLGLAWEEANRFGHRYLGPEPVLLGVLREGRGVDPDRLHEAVAAGLGGVRG
jgi:hypothetical protein